MAKRSGLAINLCSCKYEVLRDVAETLGYSIIEEEDSDDWDLCWTDLSVSIERVSRLKTFQRLNHFPAMLEICRKAALSRHIARMAARCGRDYNFYPSSLILPDQLEEFVNLLKRNKSKVEGGGLPLTYILKPSGGTMGRGISLVQTVGQLHEADISNTVAQQYIANPLLLDGYKFDLRIYALVSSVDPLKIYLYDEGLARLATRQYEAPCGGNLRTFNMHLTNFSINKHAAGFVSSDASASGAGASKRLASAVLQQVADQAGVSKASIVQDICGIVVKTLLSIQPLLAHTYHTAISAGAQHGSAAAAASYCRCPSLDHTLPGAHPANLQRSSSGRPSTVGAAAEAGSSGSSSSEGPRPTPGSHPCGCPPSQCFELLGFDIMLDEELRPWLLEVNHSPSFATDSRLDQQLKQALLTDTIAALNQTPGARIAWQEAQSRALAERLYSPATQPNRRPLSAMPRNKQLQAAAAALDEVIGSSGPAGCATQGGTASQACGGPGASNATSSSSQTAGSGAPSTSGIWGAYNGGSTGSTSSTLTSSSCSRGPVLHDYPGLSKQFVASISPPPNAAKFSTAEIEGSYGLVAGLSPSDPGKLGRFTQIYPARDSAVQSKYNSLLGVAADAFPDQRCQCAYCSRRRDIKYLQASAEHLRGASGAGGRRPFSASGSLGSLSGSHSHTRSWGAPSPGLFATASGSSASGSHTSQSITAQLRAQRRVSETIAAALEAENGAGSSITHTGGSSILQQAKVAALVSSSSGAQGRKSSARSNCSSSSANSGCSSGQVDAHSSGSCSDYSSGVTAEVAGESSASYMGSLTPRTNQLLRSVSAGAARGPPKGDYGLVGGVGQGSANAGSLGSDGNTQGDSRRAKKQQHHHRHRLEKQMARYYATLRSCGLISGDPHAARSHGGQQTTPALPLPGSSLPPAYPIFNTTQHLQSSSSVAAGKAPGSAKGAQAPADVATRQTKEREADKTSESHLCQGQSHDRQLPGSSSPFAGLPPTPPSQQLRKEGSRQSKPPSAQASSNRHQSSVEASSRPSPTSPAALSPAMSAAAAASRAALHSLRRSSSWAAGRPESPRSTPSGSDAAQLQGSIVSHVETHGKSSTGGGASAATAAASGGTHGRRPGSSNGSARAGAVKPGGVPRVASVAPHRIATPSPLERELLSMRMQTAISMSSRFVPSLSVQPSLGPSR